MSFNTLHKLQNPKLCGLRHCFDFICLTSHQLYVWILYVIFHAVASHPDTILHGKDWNNQFIKPSMNSGQVLACPLLLGLSPSCDGESCKLNDSMSYAGRILSLIGPTMRDWLTKNGQTKDNPVWRFGQGRNTPQWKKKNRILFHTGEKKLMMMTLDSLFILHYVHLQNKENSTWDRQSQLQYCRAVTSAIILK